MLRKMLCLFICFVILMQLYANSNISYASIEIRQPSIASGLNHSIFLTPDGKVRTAGYNNYGQIGGGYTGNIYNTPTAISLSSITQVAAGSNSSYALNSNGEVFAWGNNANYELGFWSSASAVLTPHKITALSNVKQIAAGYNFAFALMTDGTVKAWGNNASGQLGNGTTTNLTTPTTIANLSGVKAISAGQHSALALMEDGTVKAWGNNAYGQLGLGHTTNKLIPTSIPNLSGVVEISAGYTHALAILSDRTVKAWGQNSSGELGIGSTTHSNVPTTVPGLTNVSHVSAGNYYSFAVLRDGKARAWGANNHYQLGHGNTGSSSIPMPIINLSDVVYAVAGHNFSFFITRNNAVEGVGYNHYGQLGVENISTYRTSLTPISGVLAMTDTLKAVALNPDHAFIATGASSNSSFLLVNDTVKAWGYNNYGQLGLGDIVNRTVPVIIPELSGVKELAIGANHTVALMDDGTVRAWGYNNYGQLGLGDTVNRTIPTVLPDLSGVKQLVAGSSHTLALMEDGTVKAWGYNTSGQLGIGSTTSRANPISIPGMTGVKQLVAGANHTLALMDDGTVKAWGNNSSGQLGLGNTSNRTAPVVIPELSAVKQLTAGSSHSAALLEGGTVKAWGSNNYGHLGLGDILQRTTPTVIPDLTSVKQLKAGLQHTVAIIEDGTVKAWGYNNFGQLGLGDTVNRVSPTTIAELKGVQFLAVGAYHTIVSMEDRTVKSWGYNNYGQQGQGDLTNRTTPKTILEEHGVEHLATGGSHTLALMTDKTVKSWGINTYGQLGLGNTTTQITPDIVTGLSDVKQLAAGYNHSLALMENGTVKAWGNNNYGQLGLGNTLNQSIPVAIPGLTEVKQLIAGYYHTFAIMEDGTVKAWGYNSSGQLGLGNSANQLTPTTIPNLDGVKQVATGYDHAAALKEDGTVLAWGYNGYGQLGSGNTISRNIPMLVTGLSGVKQLSTGYRHTLALMQDSTVKAWGHNSYGQLGLGDTANRSIPTPISGLFGVRELSSGFSNHTVALLEDRSVKAWGYNNSGQLGLGDTVNRTTPTLITGLINISQIAVGSSHSISQLDDGMIKVWGSNSSSQLGYGSNRLIPTDLQMNSQSIIPKVRIQGQSQSTIYVEYYLDQETKPRETRNIQLTDHVIVVSFDRIDINRLANGNHSIKFKVGDGTQLVQSSVSFSVNNAPSQAGNTYDVSTTDQSITATVSSNSNGLHTQPYRIQIGDNASDWLSGAAAGSYTANQLVPNTKYEIRFEVRDAAGKTTAETRETYTLASPPSLALTDTTPLTVSLTVTDSNPAMTQYQIVTGNRFVSADGKLVSQQVWITLPEKEAVVYELDSGKSYKFKMKARNQEGTETEWSGEVLVGAPVKPPAIPQNVKATVTYNSTTIIWEPVMEATSYQVESNGIVQNVGANLTYTHSSLSSNTSYVYRVRANKDGTFGEWSEPLTVKTLLPAPVMPVGVTAVSTSKTVSLQWNEVIGALWYEVEWDGMIMKTDRQTAFIVRSLQPGSQHTYRVRAVSTGGAGPWTALASIMTLMSPPAVPANISAELSDTAVNLTWDAVADATYYEVESGGILFRNGEANFAVIGGLQPGTVHQYRVRAVNEIGAGAWSPSFSVTTYLLPAPKEIRNELQDTSIALSWAGVAGATSYEVESDGIISVVTSPAFIHANVQPESMHTYRIRALKPGGASSWTRPLTLTTLPAKPEPPADIRAVAGKDYITLSWNLVPNASGYEVEIDGKVVMDNFNETTYTDILLEPYTNHMYRIRSVTDAVQGEWTPAVSMMTLPDIPKAPGNIYAVSSTSIVTLKWDEDPSALSYDVEINGQVANVGKHTSYEHRRIAKGSEHKYRVRVHNAAGIGEWSPLIINNTITARLTKSKTVDLGLTALDVTDFSRYTLIVNYNPNAMEVTDLSTLTGKQELAPGRIEGTDIIITSYTPGQIIFITDKAIRPGESWTGVLNSIQFNALASGGSSITYTVVQQP